jgi:hypothetical protein
MSTETISDFPPAVTNATKGLVSADMNYLHFDIPGYKALIAMAEIYKLVKINVPDPEQIKLEVLSSEIRVKSGMKTVAQARRPNGNDQWVVQANQQITHHLDLGLETRPQFYF